MSGSPSSQLASAILLCRGTIASTLGCSLDDIPITMPLALWNKPADKDTTKVVFCIGKKDGDLSQVKLPPNDDTVGKSAFLASLASSINTTITNSTSTSTSSITVVSTTRSVAESLYGQNALYDSTTDGTDESKQLKKLQKPTKDKEGKLLPPPPVPPHLLLPRGDQPIKVAFSGDRSILGAIPAKWDAVSSLSQIGTVVFLDVGKKGGCDCNIGAKKAEITIKFKVEGGSGGSNAAVETDVSLLPSRGEVDHFYSGVVTNKIGKGMLEKQEERALAEKLAAVSVTSTGTGTDASDSTSSPANDEEMVVNAWEVSGKIDYAKLIDKFGSSPIEPELLARLETCVKKIGKVDKIHPFLRRGIFFSHRDLTKILDVVEKGEQFYLYTGRGPSSESMHLGHLVPFMMTQWLQKAFDVPLVVQMTDDEKFLWKGVYEDGDDNLDYFRGLAIQNAKDIIACGFDKKKTFLFTDMNYIQHMYPNIIRVQKSVTYSTARAMFGFEGHSNIGQSAFPAVQAVPSFPSTFMTPLNCDRNSNMACLIPCAIDQDPYFRMTRDVAHKLTPKSHPLGGKPALLHSKFFPPLQGATGKMSASDDNSAIFLTDTPERIKSKIKTHAFSGGQQTSEKQKELGANLEVDVSYQWLTFFLEDDAELKAIGDSYKSGSGDYWATGMVKDKLIDVLTKMVEAHQGRRKGVTNEEVAEWMEVRSLKF